MPFGVRPMFFPRHGHRGTVARSPPVAVGTMTTPHVSYRVVVWRACGSWRNSANGAVLPRDLSIVPVSAGCQALPPRLSFIARLRCPAAANELRDLLLEIATHEFASAMLSCRSDQDDWEHGEPRRPRERKNPRRRPPTRKIERVRECRSAVRRSAQRHCSHPCLTTISAIEGDGMRDYLGSSAARRFAGRPLRCFFTGFVVSVASNNCRNPCANSSTAFSRRRVAQPELSRRIGAGQTMVERQDLHVVERVIPGNEASR